MKKSKKFPGAKKLRGSTPGRISTLRIAANSNESLARLF